MGSQKWRGTGGNAPCGGGSSRIAAGPRLRARRVRQRRRSSGGAATLNWFIFNEPSGGPQKIAERCSQQSGGKLRDQVRVPPAQADQQREQLVRRLGAEDDVAGPARASTSSGPASSPTPAGWRPCRQPRAAPSRANVFDIVLETARFEDKLYAVPIWSNTQLLWYRKDRVPTPPKTWDEMIDTAEKIGPAKGRIQVQANRYEGLVVLANQLIESAGTSILAGPDEVAARRGADREGAGDPRPPVALARSRPPNLTTSNEDARAARLRGGRLDLHDQLPVRLSVGEGERAEDLQADGRRAVSRRSIDGKPSKPPIGGINIGVSAFSKHKDARVRRRSSAWSSPRTSSRSPSSAACRRCARTSTTARDRARSIPASPT